MPVLRENRQDIPGLDDLLASGVPFVVVGAIARNLYATRPRNTQDIDVLSADYSKLATYVHTAFPHLDMRQNPVVIRFSCDGEDIIDIMIPHNKFFESVLADTHRAGRLDVVSAEGLIAMKFAAIMSQHRSKENKYQDRGDIASILIKSQVDLDKVKQHLSILYPQAPDDFQGFVAQLKQEFDLQ